MDVMDGGAVLRMGFAEKEPTSPFRFAEVSVPVRQVAALLLDPKLVKEDLISHLCVFQHLIP